MPAGNKQLITVSPTSSSRCWRTIPRAILSSFSVQCSVYYSCDAFQGSGIAWNLSLNGWRVDGTHPVNPGTVVTLCIFLPGQHPTVFVDRAIVRWSRGQEFGVEVNTIRLMSRPASNSS